MKTFLVAPLTLWGSVLIGFAVQSMFGELFVTLLIACGVACTAGFAYGLQRSMEIIEELRGES